MKKRKFQDWSKRRRIAMGSVGILAFLYITVIVWHTFKPLPEGISVAGDLHAAEEVEMIYDLSYAQDKEGTKTESELRIFNEINDMIDQAEEFIVIDLFLFDNYNDQDMDFPAVAETLTDHLLDKKAENPDMPIYFITDPLNYGYGSYENQFLGTLEDEGVEVITTDLDKLRDSTPLYSGFYRVIFQWFDAGGRGWVPNGMSSDAPDLTVSSYLKMMNIKANHRKAVITEKEALISSANPHNASGLHGNMAFKVSGPVVNDILEAEEAVSRLSGGPDLPRVEVAEQQGDYQVQYLTERKVLDALLSDIEKTAKGDAIRLAMFYIAESSVVDALSEAANRGVDVRLILDANENAFGTEKTGLPNRPVVHEMLAESDEHLQVRWYNAVVGQFHTKSIMIQTDKETIVSGGSTNYTERAFNDYNLESNIRIVAPNDSEMTQDMEAYFDRLWNNEDALYTLETDEYQNDFTFWQRGIYGFQRLFKLTTY
ncbi:phospholipase D family protein [Microbacterium sp. APC 3898]|uniref:phospholipase D n=1 Tax=Planococcus notacanthi TaxID=3035188 RepID=A0ABT7ZKW2_9BACL|nr:MULTISPECIES: phospholipase D family protein [Terrabacteria group]MDN3427791.1 phospholipase D family protein [Planococcus sp. APC 4016]MDN3499343.1 phospholipase D family protein [Microbacterium sp. APC 3898]